MSTVTGNLDVVFSNGATLDLDLIAPLDLQALVTLNELLDLWSFVLPDVGPLTALWGPVTGISWTVTTGVGVIPIGASGWLMLSALAMLVWVARR